MFDWLEYDKKTKKGFEEQEKQLVSFLEGYIEKNARIRELPIFEKPNEEAIERIMNTEIPAKGRDPLTVGEELVNDVFEHAMLSQHPRFYSFVCSAVSPYSLAGSILADVYNINAGGWDLAPAAAALEERLVKWMGECAGYSGDNVGGIFVSGGSMANMSAMVAARDSRLTHDEFPKGRVYFSDQTHSSVAKGLRIIGFGEEQIVKIPTDDEFKIRTDLLEEAICRDINAGKKPVAVVGNLGTTNAGCIDPLDKLGEIAKKYDLWFHVDGAYGGSILLSPIYRNLAKGIELSDSLSWDTHKWLMQTYSCSTLIVKDKTCLLNSFTEHPEYLADVNTSDHLSGWDLGPEMSRPNRAIKLWYTLQATGTDLLAEMIEYSFYNANLVKKELEKRPNWKIISKPCCGTLNFRYEPEGLSPEKIDKLTDNISKKLIESGFAYIVTTVLKGRKTLRMCIINANTTEDDILKTTALLDEIAIKEAEKMLAEK